MPEHAYRPRRRVTFKKRKMVDRKVRVTYRIGGKKITFVKTQKVRKPIGVRHIIRRREKT